MTASLLDVLHFHLIYFLVIEIQLHSVGYRFHSVHSPFLTNSKWQTQQTMLQLLDAANAKKNIPSKISID